MKRGGGACWRRVRVSTGMRGGGAGLVRERVRVMLETYAGQYGYEWRWCGVLSRDPRLGVLVARYGFKQNLLKGNGRVKQNLLKVRSRYDKKDTGFTQSSLI